MMDFRAKETERAQAAAQEMAQLHLKLLKAAHDQKVEHEEAAKRKVLQQAAEKHAREQSNVSDLSTIVGQLKSAIVAKDVYELNIHAMFKRAMGVQAKVATQIADSGMPPDDGPLKELQALEVLYLRPQRPMSSVTGLLHHLVSVGTGTGMAEVSRAHGLGLMHVCSYHAFFVSHSIISQTSAPCRVHTQIPKLRPTSVQLCQDPQLRLRARLPCPTQRASHPWPHHLWW